jgi:hypothetical protein
MNYGGGGDVFIARIDSGGALAWSTYIGDSLETGQRASSATPVDRFA